MKKLWKIIFIALIFILIFMTIIKSVTNEDDWICENGRWIKHGNPASQK